MNLLSIGGSDPSGGAGIQSDIKTFNQLNVHGLTVLTAITAQNTTRFGHIQLATKKMLEEQIKSILSDFRISGIKISMVYDSSTIESLYKHLKGMEVPIVVDPVIRSTTGGVLLRKDAVKNFKKLLIPLATVITPNKFEAEYLTGIKINSDSDIHNAAKKLQNLGAKNVVITGIEKKNKMTDFVYGENFNYTESSKKLISINHGSGCNYSSALICELSKKNTLKQAIRFAKKYTHSSIRQAKSIGKGIAITQNRNQDELISELKQAITQFITIKNAYKVIPECQTNFVYAKINPKSIRDIAGVTGRIVKTKKELEVAGDIEYGGSKHVASALLSVKKKFPSIRSAMNLKYEIQTIDKFKKNKLS
ncbi:MAG: bifunctional hydroxymethylpyrimidine kinase/phosphomethylpyrimidine kinase, partial [Nitrosarchaeum sp.]|nr:bifunctional hydroxymethylpyrimidine kinase/phosphomethylpyrimidine kinase [Nitrosarchaeum sp.]